MIIPKLPPAQTSSEDDTTEQCLIKMRSVPYEGHHTGIASYFSFLLSGAIEHQAVGRFGPARLDQSGN
jgi:hypothetical protein